MRQAAWESGLARGAGVDGKRVDAARNQNVQGIIYEAMSGNPGEPGKAGTDDTHAEVPPFACAGVSGVQVTVVLDRERKRFQRRTERRFDVVCRHAHGRRSACGERAAGAASGFM